MAENQEVLQSRPAFEVAKPEDIFDFYRERGFELTRLITRGASWGCNEFIFRKRG